MLVGRGSLPAIGVGVATAVALLVYLAGTGLLTAANVVVALAAVASSTALWMALVRFDGRHPIGVVRAYFLLHLVVVQVGVVVIYFASQSGPTEAALLLGFDVHPTLTAVAVTVLGSAAFVAGVVTYGRFHAIDAGETPKRTPSFAPVVPPAVQVKRAVVLLGLGLAYVAVATAVHGSIPLLDVLRGGDAQVVRLDVHYGATSYLFHPSIVQQVPLILAPFVAMFLWESSMPGSGRRVLAFAAWGVSALLLVNSLERTSMVVVGLWFTLVVYYRRGHIPKAAFATITAAFVAMTFVLHGAGVASIQNQLFRRVAIVNAMVNYFAIEHYPADFGLLHLSSYVDYVVEGVLGGGDTFSRQLIGQLFPGQTVGTAPVGALTEAWVNVGWMFVLLLFVQGALFAHIDHRLRPLVGTAVGRVTFAGLAVLLATTSYGGLLAILFSGGVVTLLLIHGLVGRLVTPTTPTEPALPSASDVIGRRTGERDAQALEPARAAPR